MNTTLDSVPSKPTRWTPLHTATAAGAAIVATLALAIAPALAATSTLVLTGATAPRGGVVLAGTAINPATGKPVTHYWSPDHIAGLCQVNEPTATTAGSYGPCVAGGVKVTQLTAGPGPVDPITGHQLQFVYTGDLAAHANEGVLRFAYDPQGNGGQGAMSSFAQSIAPGCGIEGNLPWGAALGPDGNLYLSFKKNGNIVRVKNPAGNPTCADVQVIGQSSDTKKAFALAFEGENLWEVDGNGVGVIQNARNCAVPPQGTCNASAVITAQIAAPNAIAADSVNHTLYVGNANAVYQVTSANNPFFMGVSQYAPNFQFVFGLAVDTTNLVAGTTPVVWATDDASRGLTPGTGRIFKLLP